MEAWEFIQFSVILAQSSFEEDRVVVKLYILFLQICSID